MDMKTGEVSYCAYDAMFYAFALAEFLRRWTGREVPVGGGEYCEAKEPGYYAALEKAYKAMTIAAFTGRNPNIGQGLLDDGKTLSPVQLMLEREFSEGIRTLGRDIEVTADTLALDTIVRVRQGLTENFLDQEHTLSRYRDCLWCPETIDRSGHRDPAHEAQVLQQLQQKVDDMVASYRKPEVDPGALAKMRAVVERARKHLVT